MQFIRTIRTSSYILLAAVSLFLAAAVFSSHAPLRTHKAALSPCFLIERIDASGDLTYVVMDDTTPVTGKAFIAAVEKLFSPLPDGFKAERVIVVFFDETMNIGFHSR